MYTITERPRDYLNQKPGIWWQHVPRKLWNEKTPNSSFFINGEPKHLIINWVIWVHLSIIYVYHHREASWLFKSEAGHLMATRVAKEVTKKALNLNFFFSEPFIRYKLGNSGLFVHMYRIITQRPHDHLFQNSGIFVQLICAVKARKRKIAKSEFLLQCSIQMLY